VLVICQDEVVLLQLAQKMVNVQPVESAKSGSNMPCQCASFDLAWQRPSRTLPKCIYVDLGAADGNTLTTFLQGEFGPVAKCGSAENPGDYEAFLVEANPVFDAALQNLSDTGQGRIHAVNSTAIYMCNASTTFFVEDDVEHNHWGSSMDGGSHADDDWMALTSEIEENGKSRGLPWPFGKRNKRERQEKHEKHEITVPTMNLMQFLYEQTIPDDWVIVKMDVEGAEWDIVPCLARSPVANLVDKLYMEEHPIKWQLGNTTREEMDLATKKLTDLGVQTPKYYSKTL